MKVEEIIEEASKLSEKQRVSIASQLLQGLESPKHSVSDDEVAERMQEATADPSVMISFDEFLDGIKRSGC